MFYSKNRNYYWKIKEIPINYISFLPEEIIIEFLILDVNNIKSINCCNKKLNTIGNIAIEKIEIFKQIDKVFIQQLKELNKSNIEILKIALALEKILKTTSGKDTLSSLYFSTIGLESSETNAIADSIQYLTRLETLVLKNCDCVIINIPSSLKTIEIHKHS